MALVVAREADAVLRTLALAAGEMTESAFSAWLKSASTRKRIRSR